MIKILCDKCKKESDDNEEIKTYQLLSNGTEVDAGELCNSCFRELAETFEAIIEVLLRKSVDQFRLASWNGWVLPLLSLWLSWGVALRSQYWLGHDFTFIV